MGQIKSIELIIIEEIWRLQNYNQMIKQNRDRSSGFIYLQPPESDPKRYEIVKYATWRMRLYQQLESLSLQQIKKRATQTMDKMFPKLCQTEEQKQFYMEFLLEFSDTQEKDQISYFICLMLYSRDLKNNDTFIKMERLILSLRLDRIANSPTKMNLLKELVKGLTNLPLNQLTVTREFFQQHEQRITHWYDRNQKADESRFMKIPFEQGEAGLRRRKCYIHKGYVYADVQTSSDIVKNLYMNYLKQKILKTRTQTEKLLENDVENQLKPFMDKAINSISTATIEETELNSEFKLNLKNIEAVYKKFFPPCMLHLNKKLRQNNHLKHEGRRQLWLFFKGCGMDVNDNKQYFSKYLGLKVSNSDLKGHMYNIEHAYGLVGKKEQQRAKICRTIIIGPDPKRDQHHGCPFKHWNKQTLAQFLHANYNLKENQLKQIMEQKENNSYMVACGRLFEANFKPETGDLPQEITGELGKSPHQYFIAGMEATQWINTKTLRPTKKKPVQNQSMQLQF